MHFDFRARYLLSGCHVSVRSGHVPDRLQATCLLEFVDFVRVDGFSENSPQFTH